MITTQLSPYEVELLASLVKQLVELVSDGEPAGFPAGPESADPFDALVADLEVDPDEPEVSEDPVLKRLFPDAYPHDTTASSEFRRFTERDLRARRWLRLRWCSTGSPRPSSGRATYGSPARRWRPGCGP